MSHRAHTGVLHAKYEEASHTALRSQMRGALRLKKHGEAPCDAENGRRRCAASHAYGGGQSLAPKRRKQQHQQLHMQEQQKARLPMIIR